MKKIMLLSLTILLTLASNNSIALEKINVLLDWFINPDHAPLIIAQEKGYFNDQDLAVQLIQPADPSDPPKLVASGKADIGITYQPEYMQHVDHGLPIIAFGSLVDRPLNCLTVLKGQHIKDIKDLKGKSIATSNTGLASIVIKTMLADAGLNEQDVELIHVRYNLIQALLSKKVVAANGMMRNIEIPVLESKQQEVIVFYPENYGVPNYHELIYISHIKNKDNKNLKRFIQALTKATHWLKQHPEEGWQIFARQYPAANNTVNKKAWFATIPLLAKDPAGFKQADWQNFGYFMLKNKLIHQVQSASRYYVILSEAKDLPQSTVHF